MLFNWYTSFQFSSGFASRLSDVTSVLGGLVVQATNDEVNARMDTTREIILLEKGISLPFKCDQTSNPVFNQCKVVV